MQWTEWFLDFGRLFFFPPSVQKWRRGKKIKNKRNTQKKPTCAKDQQVKDYNTVTERNEQIWSSPKLVSNAPNENRMLSAQLLHCFSLCTVSLSIYICIYIFKKLNTKSYLGIMLRVWQGQRGKKVAEARKFKPGAGLGGVDGNQGCSPQPGLSSLLQGISVLSTHSNAIKTRRI